MFIFIKIIDQSNEWYLNQQENRRNIGSLTIRVFSNTAFRKTHWSLSLLCNTLSFLDICAITFRSLYDSSLFLHLNGEIVWPFLVDVFKLFHIPHERRWYERQTVQLFVFYSPIMDGRYGTISIDCTVHTHKLSVLWVFFL